jgi:2-oxo-4-hydroxy-4-carboxy--5-ureidoimidazoline (OHCU) decarboxylase
MNITSLNALDRSAASSVLGGCCASSRWVDEMVSGRPYRDTIELFTAAEEAWWDLDTDDWLEAFSAHADGPSEFFEQFGFPYVIHRNGRSEAELTTLLETRLAADPLTEIQTAALEQARVTNLRLRELLDGV